jgi:hypothetical protein
LSSIRTISLGLLCNLLVISEKLTMSEKKTVTLSNAFGFNCLPAWGMVKMHFLLRPNFKIFNQLFDLFLFSRWTKGNPHGWLIVILLVFRGRHAAVQSYWFWSKLLDRTGSYRWFSFRSGLVKISVSVDPVIPDRFTKNMRTSWSDKNHTIWFAGSYRISSNQKIYYTGSYDMIHIIWSGIDYTV